MSVAAAVAELVAALEGTGLRVAVRDGDITPPVVYVRIGTVSDAGAPLAGGTLCGFYVYYIPIRGVDNLAGDAEALDALYAALSPLAWADLNATASTRDGQERHVAVLPPGRVDRRAVPPLRKDPARCLRP